MSVLKLVEKKPAQMEIRDDSERLVSGYASVQVVDADGEVVPIDELKASMLKYIDRGGNIIYGHSNKPVGKVLQWEVKMHPDAKVPAVWILAKIYDDYEIDNKVWEAIKEGKLTGFSIGATAKVADAYVKDVDGNTRKVKALRGVELLEISLVESPANPLALFEEVNYVAKGEGEGVEKQDDLARLHEQARDALRAGDLKRYRDILGKIEAGTEELERRLQASGVKGEAEKSGGMVKVVVPSQIGADVGEIRSLAEKYEGKVSGLKFGGFSIEVDADDAEKLVEELARVGYELGKGKKEEEKQEAAAKAKQITVKITHPDDYEGVRKVVRNVDDTARVEHAGNAVMIEASDEKYEAILRALESAGFLKGEGVVSTERPAFARPVAGRRRRRREPAAIGVPVEEGKEQAEKQEDEEEAEDIWAERYARAFQILRRNGIKVIDGDFFVDGFSVLVPNKVADRAARFLRGYFGDYDIGVEQSEEDENASWIDVTESSPAEKQKRLDALRDEVAFIGFGKSYSELCDKAKELVDDAIAKRTTRPPKAWWDKCVARIREGNPDYTDEQVRATCGSMWYHEWGMGTKKGDVKKYQASVWVYAETRRLEEEVDDIARKYGGEFQRVNEDGGYAYVYDKYYQDFIDELARKGFEFQEEEELEFGEKKKMYYDYSAWVDVEEGSENERLVKEFARKIGGEFIRIKPTGGYFYYMGEDADYVKEWFEVMQINFEEIKSRKKGRFWVSAWMPEDERKIMGIARKYRGRIVERRGNDFIIDVPAGADTRFMADMEAAGVAVEPIQAGLGRGVMPRIEEPASPFPSISLLAGKNEELKTMLKKGEEIVDVQKPFGRWRSFKDCVSDMKRQGYAEENAKRICGKLQAELGERKKQTGDSVVDWVVDNLHTFQGYDDAVVRTMRRFDIGRGEAEVAVEEAEKVVGERHLGKDGSE